MTPMPPSHCIIERQMRMPWGSASRSVTIDAPVVEKPADVSKMAFVKLLMEPVNRNGSVPNMAIAIQVRPTTAKPSFMERSCGRSNRFQVTQPASMVMPAANRISNPSLHSR